MLPCGLIKVIRPLLLNTLKSEYCCAIYLQNGIEEDCKWIPVDTESVPPLPLTIIVVVDPLLIFNLDSPTASLTEIPYAVP